MSCRRTFKIAVAAAIAAHVAISPALAQTPAAPPANDLSSGRPGVTVREISPEETGKGPAVTLSLCVEADGTILKAELAKSSGDQRLDEATLKGITKQRMSPAKDKKGNPVRMCGYRLTIEWQFEN